MCPIPKTTCSMKYPSSCPEDPGKEGKRVIYTIAIVLLVALDQLVKYGVKTAIPLGGQVDFIPHVLGLTHLRNTGAAFSMLDGGGARWFFVILTAVVVLVLLYLLYAKKITHPLGCWTLTLIVAGALGNLIDRVLYGNVVDMFETLFMHFPIFNVADIFVVVGGIGFCVYYGFLHDKWQAKHNKEGAEEPHEDSL